LGFYCWNDLGSGERPKFKGRPNSRGTRERGGRWVSLFVLTVDETVLGNCVSDLECGPEVELVIGAGKYGPAHFPSVLQKRKVSRRRPKQAYCRINWTMVKIHTKIG
jgi:hypothetical protein